MSSSSCFIGQHRLISRRPWQAWPAWPNLYSIVIDLPPRARSPRSLGFLFYSDPIRLSRVDVVLRTTFSGCVAASPFLFIIFPRHSLEVAYWVVNDLHFSLDRAALVGQRAELYRYHYPCQGIRRPISQTRQTIAQLPCPTPADMPNPIRIPPIPGWYDVCNSSYGTHGNFFVPVGV